MNQNFKPHFHMTRYSLALLKAFTTPLFVYFTVAGNTVMFLCAYLFYRCEQSINDSVNSYGDALWWALCTVSTIGYGDIYPMTTAGRWIGVFLILAGVLFFLGATASIASILATHSIEKKPL